MTELLEGSVEVRTIPDGSLTAVRTSRGWRPITATVNRWIVETDWWRAPVRRDYRRCLTPDGDCLELYCDLATATWSWSRRYD